MNTTINCQIPDAGQTKEPVRLIDADEVINAVDHMEEPKLAYRGYTATVEYDEDDKLWHGILDGIKDLVNFHAFEIENIEQEFHNAVDDYLGFCARVGKEPEKPNV
nr:MAG TPA: putative nuclease [Caudoviricetes sp.]